MNFELFILLVVYHLWFMVFVDGQEHGLRHPNPSLTTTDNSLREYY